VSRTADRQCEAADRKRVACSWTFSETRSIGADREAEAGTTARSNATGTDAGESRDRPEQLTSAEAWVGCDQPGGRASAPAREVRNLSTKSKELPGRGGELKHLGETYPRLLEIEPVGLQRDPAGFSKLGWAVVPDVQGKAPSADRARVCGRDLDAGAIGGLENGDHCRLFGTVRMIYAAGRSGSSGAGSSPLAN